MARFHVCTFAVPIRIHAIFTFALLVMLVPVSLFAAATYTVRAGDTLSKIATANHLTTSRLASLNPQIKNINLIYPGQTITLSKSTTSTISSSTQPATSSPTAGTPNSIPAAGESRFTAYLTGYGWPDNTPASAEISHGVIHTRASGTGTFADPVTLAVGHSILSGKDMLDYPAGTKFYIPTLRKYFIVEDTCGDGRAPQNGPCHTGYKGNVWLDVWVGGQNASASSVYKCEEAITDTHLVIKNPASNYAVVSGPIYSSSGCAKLYGDTVVTK